MDAGKLAKWCPAIQFGKNYARGPFSQIAHSLAFVGDMALNLILLDKSIKMSIETEQLLAARSDEFLAALPGIEVPGEDEDHHIE